MRAFDFASRVARLFATRGAVLQNADIRKFAPKGRQHRGEELAFNVVNEDVFLRNARLIDELANDGQNHLRSRVAKIVLFTRSAVVQVDFDRDDFALLVPAFEFSGRLVEMTEDFVPSVAVGVGAGQRLEGDRDHFFALIAVGVFVEPPLVAFFLPLAGPARGFRIMGHHDATGEDSFRFADRFVRRAGLPVETGRRAIAFVRFVTGRIRVFRAFGRADRRDRKGKCRRR